MSIFDDKIEELKERRSDALNGIISSQQNINETAIEDSNTDKYLFSTGGNQVGILYLLGLYQEERICEKNISYIIRDLTQSNIEAKISEDLTDVMGTNSTAPRYSTNNLYYIDSNFNIELNYNKNNKSLFFNNSNLTETQMTSAETRADTVLNDLGESYPDDDFISGSYAELENSNRGSGFLKYWNSHNKITITPGGGDDDPTSTIGGEDKIWIWHTTQVGGYQVQGHISSLLSDLKTLIDNLTNLASILTSIQTARTWMSSDTGKVFWEEMTIPNDTITPEQIAQVNSWKNDLNSYYTPLYEERTTNDEWIDDSTPSDSLFNKLNTAINNLVNFFNQNDLISFLTTRFFTSTSVLGSNENNGLRKWINFWLTEKISLDNGSYTSLYFLEQSIADEVIELGKAEDRLKEILGNDNKEVIPTLSILASYSDPLFDKTTGKTLQERIGVVFDGQLHGKKYIVYRKNAKAFDYYGNGTYAFKWDNSDWTIFSQKGDKIYPDITEQDPESGLIKTEILYPIEDDDFYIFRVKEYDVNPIYLTNINSSISPAYSRQSKMFDEEKSFSNIQNGVIKYNNHGFKRGDFVLIKSDITDRNIYSKNLINGFYRVVDADENTFVLEGLPNTSSGGKFYRAFGVATIKPLPYVSYDENGKPSLFSKS